MGDQAEYMEQLTVGMIVEGKVKSLTKFGAFITLPDGSTGMVHISEVAHTYVNDIHDHLHEGDTVKVMIIGMENGKTNLSIKRTIAPPPRKEYVPRQRTNGSAPASGYGKPANRSGARPTAATPPSRPLRRNRSMTCSKNSCPNRIVKCPPSAPIPIERPRRADAEKPKTSFSHAE